MPSSPGRPTEVIDRVREYEVAGADWVNIAVRAPIEMDVLESFASRGVAALQR